MRSYRRTKKRSLIPRIAVVVAVLGLILFGHFSMPKTGEFFKGLLGIILPSKSVRVSDIARADLPSPQPVHKATPTPSLTPTPTATPTPTYPPSYCLSVPILYYHHIQPLSDAKAKNQLALTVDTNIFSNQMQYLVSHNYTALSAEQLIDALVTHAKLPAKSVVLTFDDGYKDFYTNAYPILKSDNLLANLLIPTGLMEGQDYMSWSQISDLNASGKMYFINHTWSHYGVGSGTETKITYEITTANDQLSQRVGKAIDVFGYPYGSFGKVAISVLKKLGYKGALSTVPGFNQCESFIFALHRTRIGNTPLSSYGI